MFPEINRVRKTSTMISVFRGLNRTENCGFSKLSRNSQACYTELSEMENLCDDDYPQLRTRQKRSELLIQSADYEITSNLLACNGGLVYIAGNYYLVINRQAYDIHGYLDAQAEAHTLTLYGNRVVILPEKIYAELSARGTVYPIEAKSETQTVSTTALNAALQNVYTNSSNYMGRRVDKTTINFKDFSIEKVALDETGKPRKVNYIFEQAYGLEDEMQQTKMTWQSDYQPGAEDDAADAWREDYYRCWGAVSEGETVEAQGETPSALYLCTEVSGGSYLYEANEQKTYRSYTAPRKFVRVEGNYVKISRNRENVTPFTGIRKGDWVKISGVTGAVKKPLVISGSGTQQSPYVYWADVDGVTAGHTDYPDGFWGNYREVLNGNTFKVFYADDNCIVIQAAIDKSVPYTGPMTVERVMPMIDDGKMLEVGNRLWACSSTHNEIYSCKQGDVTNWQAYGDGIATDSYAATVGNEGVFTGIARQNDSVIFFKENWIMKLFGTKPANFTLASYNVPGVAQGSEKSVVWVNGVLFYLSRTGVCQYSPGGMPVVISEQAFGRHHYRNGVAGRHKNKYVLCAQNESNAWELLVFDTEKGLWYKEDNLQIRDCVTYNSLLYYVYVNSAGKTVLGCMEKHGNFITGATTEGDFAWRFETPNFYETDFGKKYISKIQIMLDGSESLRVEVWAQFSHGGAWVQLRTLHRLEGRHACLGVPVRRSDFLKLRVEGFGECRISGMQIDYARGSDRTWQF